jgi:SNF2 family DNA or RNA helicase
MIAGLRTQPWDHQLEAIDSAAGHRGFMLAMEMGTGKSLTAIGLMHAWGARRVLIACPLSVVGVWPRELDQHSEWGWHIARLDRGSVREKASEAARAYEIATTDGHPVAVIVNHESLWREPFGSWAKRTPWDLLVVDESHRAKAPGGKLSRYLQALGMQVKRCLALTGTPLPHSPLDAYGQFRFFAPSAYGRSFQRMRDRYAVMGGYENKQVVGWRNMDEFERVFSSRSFQARKQDVLDLPEEIDARRTCRLEPRAMKLYRQLEEMFWIDVGKGEVTASNALVQLLRLQQITSGTIGTDDGELEHVSTAKEELFADVLSDFPQGEPIIAFARFHADLDAIHRVCEKQGRRHGELSGRRRDLTPEARMPEDIDVLAVQIQSGGVGIDLTRASTAIYYSLGFSLGDYLQSRSRLHRPGQRRNVTFLHLEAEQTIDGKVLDALSKRQKVVERILARAHASGSAASNPSSGDDGSRHALP